MAPSKTAPKPCKRFSKRILLNEKFIAHLPGVLFALISSGAILAGTRSGNGLAIDDFNNIYVWNSPSDTWILECLITKNLHDLAASGDGNLFVLVRFGITPRDRFIGVDPGLNLIANVLQPEFFDSAGIRTPHTSFMILEAYFTSRDSKQLISTMLDMETAGNSSPLRSTFFADLGIEDG